MTKPEFSVGDRVAWNYGIGKGKGHILEKVTKTTKFAGKNFKASPEEPKYLIKSDKGKPSFFTLSSSHSLLHACHLKHSCGQLVDLAAIAMVCESARVCIFALLCSVCFTISMSFCTQYVQSYRKA